MVVSGFRDRGEERVGLDRGVQKRVSGLRDRGLKKSVPGFRDRGV